MVTTTISVAVISKMVIKLLRRLKKILICQKTYFYAYLSKKMQKLRHDFTA